MQERTSENPMIIYRRSGGFPQVRHRLEIYGDGRTVYRSRTAKVESYIPMPRLEEISRMFDENNFFSMLRFYSPRELHGDPMEYELAVNFPDRGNRVIVVTEGTPPEFWARNLATTSTSGDPPARFWDITKAMEEVIKENFQIFIQHPT